MCSSVLYYFTVPIHTCPKYLDVYLRPYKMPSFCRKDSQRSTSNHSDPQSAQQEPYCDALPPTIVTPPLLNPSATTPTTRHSKPTISVMPFLPISAFYPSFSIYATTSSCGRSGLGHPLRIRHLSLLSRRSNHMSCRMPLHACRHGPLNIIPTPHQSTKLYLELSEPYHLHNERFD